MRLKHVHENHGNHDSTSYQCNLNCQSQAVLFSPVLICTYTDPGKHPYQKQYIYLVEFGIWWNTTYCTSKLYGIFDRFQVNKKILFSKFHISEQLISVLMTLLKQRSATEDKCPYQDYSPFLKWTWHTHSLGQRSFTPMFHGPTSYLPCS